MPSPGSDGVYSILEGGVTTADVAFAEAYEAARGLKRRNGTSAPAPPPSVNLAVVDSGVYSAGDSYFEERMGASGDATGGQGNVAMTRGKPATEGQHGAHVASIAASGTTMIKIIDAQVASTQEGGSVKVAVWTTAYKWVVEQRAQVVNVSINCPWKEPAISGLVNANSGILFLSTSGNANTEFSADYLKENGLTEGNVLMVAGCARDGSRENNRAFGEGIDIFVPSMAVPGRIAKRFAQKQFHKRDVKFRESENGRLDRDRDAIAGVKKKLVSDPTNKGLLSRLLREEKGLEVGINKLPTVAARSKDRVVPEEHLKVADDGVSFGIPMVANVAAKMYLIHPGYTAKEIIRTVRATAKGCAAGRVLDPVACYQAALVKRREWALRI